MKSTFKPGLELLESREVPAGLRVFATNVPAYPPPDPTTPPLPSVPPAPADGGGIIVILPPVNPWIPGS